jgi:DNA-binding LacI/PurR family transcriptional regulator
MGPTLADIAKKAGVSHSAVSKILHSDQVNRFSRETVVKVKKIAAELNYKPNQFALSLKTGRSNCIGISTLTVGRNFLERFSDLYLSNIYSGIGHALAKKNIKLIFHEVSRYTDTIELAQRRMVDGLIFILFSETVAEFKRIESEFLAQLDIPYVVVHSLDMDMQCHQVGLNCAAGGFKAAEHLVQHGYKRIGLVKPLDNVPDHLQHLLEGFHNGLERHCLRVDEQAVFAAEVFSVDAGIEVAEKISALPQRPEALFVTYQTAALGIIKKCSEMGLRLPADLALISFAEEVKDFHDVLGLTCVLQPGFKKGETAGKLLLDVLEQNGGPARLRKIILEPELVIRKSCGCN